MFNEEDKKYIKQFLEDNGGSVYIGADSQKFSKGTANYTVVLVVHLEDSKGCKIFGYTEKERDFDKSKNKPRMRLMAEVQKVVDLYTEFEYELMDRNVEIHIDVNPDPQHGSNAVYKQAVGYIRGVCGIDPKTKPEAFAASYAADQGVRKHWF